ncbi:DUF2141 domain-containing protein [Azospirillum sp. SYSU D00513]|uniref:DUF2141 domain-containing protein n=1 Tax=Azospirillum sp. SYSU D00513 TaxID=2812561 RepID=UPI0032B5EFF6
MAGRSAALALLLSFALAGAGADGAVAADLTVTVRGVANAEGSVLVAVCTETTFLTPSCPYTGGAPARAGEVAVTVRGVPPGRYAVQSFHDENGNTDLDRNFLGMPKEGLGFGNDAPIRMGPPGFEESAVAVAEPSGRTALSLRYFMER